MGQGKIETEIKFWETSKRKFDYAKKTLVMGILNVTPDSFSDGGSFFEINRALRQAEKLISEGADILDIGGESTRPNSRRISAAAEIERVVPVIERISQNFDIAVSIDTTKSEVAEAAINAGAEIINDISGLRWDEAIASVAAKTKAALILMNLRGTFEEMHKQKAAEDILSEVCGGFRWSLEKATSCGVKKENIALDIGIGFGKTFAQNLELLAELNQICCEFADFPVLVGTSRKSFIGRILGDAPPAERIYGTAASVAIAVFNGAKIVRVHDVRAAVETVRVAEAIKNHQNRQDGGG